MRLFNSSANNSKLVESDFNQNIAFRKPLIFNVPPTEANTSNYTWFRFYTIFTMFSIENIVCVFVCFFPSNPVGTQIFTHYFFYMFLTLLIFFISLIYSNFLCISDQHIDLKDPQSNPIGFCAFNILSSAWIQRTHSIQ